MTLILSRFSFSVIGLTKGEVEDKLDALVNERILAEGGEPWLVTTDLIQKELIGKDILDPNGWVYLGRREVQFAGPTVLDPNPLGRFGDGFRPQQDGD